MWGRHLRTSRSWIVKRALQRHLTTSAGHRQHGSLQHTPIAQHAVQQPASPMRWQPPLQTRTWPWCSWSTMTMGRRARSGETRTNFQGFRTCACMRIQRGPHSINCGFRTTRRQVRFSTRIERLPTKSMVSPRRKCSLKSRRHSQSERALPGCVQVTVFARGVASIATHFLYIQPWPSLACMRW